MAQNQDTWESICVLEHIGMAKVEQFHKLRFGLEKIPESDGVVRSKPLIRNDVA